MRAERDNPKLDRAIAKAKTHNGRRCHAALTDEERLAILEMIADMTLPAKDGAHEAN